MTSEILRDVKKYYEQGNIELAIKKIKEILVKEAENLEALALLGALYASQNKLTESHKILDKVLKLNGSDFETICNLGYVLDKLGKHEDAVSVNKKAIDLRPNDYWANLNYAVSLIKINQFIVALEYLNYCKTIDKSNYIAWLTEGQLYQTQKKHTYAINVFEVALRKCNRNDDKNTIIKNKFISMIELNMFGEILEEFKKIRNIDKNNYELLIQAGVAYAKLNLYQESLEQFHQVNKMLPDSYLALFNIAKANKELGNYQDALKNYDKCIQIYDCIDSKINKIIILIELNRNKEAIELSNKIINNNSENIEIYINLSKAYINIGEYEESLICINKALNIEERYEALFNKAVALQAQKKYTRANEIYLKNISNNEKDFESKYNLATSQLSTLEFKEGWENYESRWKSKKNDAKKILTKLPFFNIKKNKEKTFIWREQGLGDEILFSTMYGDINKLTSNFTVQVDTRLINIFRRTYPLIDFVDSSNKVKQSLYKQHLPAGSLGAYLRTKVEDFKSNDRKRLIAESEKVKKYKLILNSTKDKKICGLTWQSKNRNIGPIKSLNLVEYLPILKNSEYIFVNLQYDSKKQEILEFNNKYGVNLINLDEVDHFNDLETHLAIIEACDLIISASNSTAHLSGALGKETYLLAPSGPSLMWYWLNNDENGKNLWYPSLTVFEQEIQSTWNNKIQEICKKLKMIKS